MAWPYDQGGYMTPQLSAMMLGSMGGSGAGAFGGGDAASGAQNIASLFGAAGAGSGPSFGSQMGAQTTSGMQAAGGGVFQGISDIWGGDGFFGRNSVLGGTDDRGVVTKGWAPVALGIGQAIMGGIQGQRTQKLAESQFKEGKRQFDLNYGAQRQGINTQLEDRQRARVASNPGAYQSVSEYMDKNRIN